MTLTLPPLSEHYRQRQPSAIRIASMKFAERKDGTEAVNVAIGILARLMPQLQVFFVAMPINILAGFLILLLLLGSLMSVFLDYYQGQMAFVQVAHGGDKSPGEERVGPTLSADIFDVGKNLHILFMTN